MIVKAYVLHDVHQRERILVIRTEDVDLLRMIIKKMYKIRNERIRKIAEILEGDLDG